MRSIDSLDHIRIASPCPVGWEQMSGNARVRFCDQCSLHVYNIAELTRTEAEALIASVEGRLCARLYRRADGTIITRDCPVGLSAIRRRVAKIAGAAFAAILSLCAGVAGQKQSKDKSCQKQVQITRKMTDAAIDNGAVTGVLVDPNGALIAGAKIIITNTKTKTSRETGSDAEGKFNFGSLSPGTYDLTMEQSGFKKLALKGVALAANETISLDVILTVSTTVTMGVIVDDSPLSTPPGTMILSGETIRKLPIR